MACIPFLFARLSVLLLKCYYLRGLVGHPSRVMRHYVRTPLPSRLFMRTVHAPDRFLHVPPSSHLYATFLLLNLVVFCLVFVSWNRFLRWMTLRHAYTSW